MRRAAYLLRYLGYFAAPIPSREGLSSYRFPGLYAHVPVALWLVAVGVNVTLWHPALWPLFPLYLVAAVYVGRDIALMAHSNLVLLLAVVVGFVWAAADPKSWSAVFLPPTGSLWTSLLVSAALAAGFAWWVRWMWGKEPPTPLHDAVVNHDLPKIRRLIAKGADLGAHAESHTFVHGTPLHFAANLISCPDGVAIAETLIAAGADVNARNRNGATPLHIAAGHAFSSDLVRALIAAGADTGAKDTVGNTALHAAAHNCNAQNVKALLAAGADVNATNAKRETPLHLAAEHPRWQEKEHALQVVHILLEARADLRAADGAGKLPLERLHADCDPTMRELLDPARLKPRS